MAAAEPDDPRLGILALEAEPEVEQAFGRAMHASGVFAGVVGATPSASVQEIGDALMHRYVLPLEIAGVLLTAALIGAVVLAMPERTEEKP